MYPFYQYARVEHHKDKFLIRLYALNNGKYIEQEHYEVKSRNLAYRYAETHAMNYFEVDMTKEN